ncbi:heme o synthase [Stieleria varia]|uniref:Protoheme IX farnesyltransferase n=1 Tax=Stieleria varia TaxID=2528005 RepID=A0A5C6A5B5_9BACT|nr:heme o synthase [Stieleria varia]TWT94575.1 Protoheme IX farnesyltransferase [Stieleria varia]
MSIDVLTADIARTEVTTSVEPLFGRHTTGQENDPMDKPTDHSEPTAESSIIANEIVETVDATSGKKTSREKMTVDNLDRPQSLTRDLVELSKPRIVVMILVTTIATAMIAAGGFVEPISLCVLLVGTGLVAASAGASNQIWERKIDRQMPRTARRPLPGGRMGLPTALAMAAISGVAGTAMLYSHFSLIPAAAGVVTWLMYVLVYTPMKTRTAWNTTVGAVAGALPMLIGYTALDGSLTDWTPWLLVGVLVAWQYPHFMAIAWMYRRQYAAAGFQMTTTVEPTGRSAGWQSIVGSLGLIGCAVALCWIPGGWIGGSIASIAVTVSCLPMLLRSIRFARQRDDVSARALMLSSLLVLPAILLVVTLRVFW